MKQRIEAFVSELSNSDQALVAFLATLLESYMAVLWDGTPVEETALAPAYAAAGDSWFALPHWDDRADMAMGNRGQANLSQLFIGVLIAAIIAIKVFIPTVQNAISSSNVSGTTKTILGLLSLFAALLLLISLAAPLMRKA